LREPLRETFALLRHSPEVCDDHVLEENLPDEPMTISADASQLKQVFWNLSRNALQAMPSGGTLRVEMNRAANGRLRIPSLIWETACRPNKSNNSSSRFLLRQAAALD
jgi:signal transduction histidine kinase